MNFDPFFNIQFVKLTDGLLTDDYQVYLDGFFSTINAGLSDDGWTLPQQPTATITSLSTIMPNGTMWYDSTTDEFKVLIGGVVKVVTVT